MKTRNLIKLIPFLFLAALIIGLCIWFYLLRIGYFEEKLNFLNEEKETPTLTSGWNKSKATISVETPIAPDGGMVFGNGTFDVGTMVSIKAIPRDDKKFIGWYENDILISNDTVYKFKAENDRKIVGYFK